jgi:hypothetical protein
MKLSGSCSVVISDTVHMGKVINLCCCCSVVASIAVLEKLQQSTTTKTHYILNDNCKRSYSRAQQHKLITFLMRTVIEAATEPNNKAATTQTHHILDKICSRSYIRAQQHELITFLIRTVVEASWARQCESRSICLLIGLHFEKCICFPCRLHL